MNVNLQTCDSCFKSETLYLSYCSIKILPLPALSEIHFALCFLGFYVTSVYKEEKLKKEQLLNFSESEENRGKETEKKNSARTCI